MLEDKSDNKLVKVDNDKNLVAADTAKAALLPLEEEQKQIVQNIITAPDAKELQAQFELFNISQSKKNALRTIKLNGLLDKIEDQAVERFEKRPDQISNKELLDYMQVVSTQIDRSQKYMDTLKEKPSIREINQTKNEVNINIGTQLNRDSKAKVIDVIQEILKKAQNIAETPVYEENTSTEEPIDLEEDPKIEENSDEVIQEEVIQKGVVPNEILNTEDDDSDFGIE